MRPCQTVSFCDSRNCWFDSRGSKSRSSAPLLGPPLLYAATVRRPDLDPVARAAGLIRCVGSLGHDSLQLKAARCVIEALPHLAHMLDRADALRAAEGLLKSFLALQQG